MHQSDHAQRPVSTANRRGVNTADKAPLPRNAVQVARKEKTWAVFAHYLIGLRNMSRGRKTKGVQFMKTPGQKQRVFGNFTIMPRGTCSLLIISIDQFFASRSPIMSIASFSPICVDKSEKIYDNNIDVLFPIDECQLRRVDGSYF